MPFRSLAPWNDVAPAIRLIDPRIESTWSWFAWISSFDNPPVFADWLTSACSSFISELTSVRPPSAVPMMLLARSALSMAWAMPVFSERRFSLAMRPAGLSAPLLIFKPVLSRSRLVFRLLLLDRSTRCASNELTLVLILLMVYCLSVTLTVPRFSPGSAAPRVSRPSVR